MIKITRVEIDGFIAENQKVELDFPNSNVVCIYGVNGSGKTTFLEILFAVFDSNEEILRKYNVKKIKIEYIFEDEEIKKQIRELEYILNNEVSSKEVESLEEEIKKLEKEISIPKEISIYSSIDTRNQLIYDFDELKSSHFNNISSLFLGIGRGIHKNQLKIPREMIWHFFRINKKISEDKILTSNEIDELTDKLLNTLIPKGKNNEIEDYRVKELDDSKNLYLPNIEIEIIETFLNNKYKEAVLDAKNKIKESLFKTSLNFFKSSLSIQEKINLKELKEKLIYNKALLLEILSNDEDIEIKTIFEDLEKDKHFIDNMSDAQKIILFSIINKLNREVELYQEIQNFLNEYNKFLSYNKKLVLSANGLYIAPQNHSIEKLSSGERHLLTFLATILLMGEEQDFILLDEPEISLDIEWQEKLLSTISKIAPNAQIITASHSPSIMGDYFDESIEINIHKESDNE